MMVRSIIQTLLIEPNVCVDLLMVLSKGKEVMGPKDYFSTQGLSQSQLDSAVSSSSKCNAQPQRTERESGLWQEKFSSSPYRAMMLNLH